MIFGGSAMRVLWVGLVCLVLMGCDEGGAYLVTRVVDGDTFIVQGPEGRDRVRLRLLNAPEMDEPGGPEAKAALEKQLLGKRVHLTIYARDVYGRMVAEVGN